MAGDTMNSVFQKLQPLAAALALAACGADNTGEPPLAGARIGGPFTLTDQNGKRVQDADFAGKYRIVYFGYTYCPDVCPTDLAKIGAAFRALEKQAPRTAAKIVPLFISVDPERDTPAQLKQYVGNFHPRLIGLTGTPQQVAQVAKAYAIAYMKQPTPSGYLMGHSEVAYLMGPDGKPITSLPLEKDPPAIVAELEHWVR
ncbi:SCO family protein [Sphingomonas sp. HT-1]|uniref:SCO family protein n=1 Tax=unclassified Sphingomonas TaxID=196159 RepID=UPI000382D2A2|nr:MULTISPECIES: SCO family protein [unclassified Sphingomonas]KTF69694.1 electron transporter [Sphingomonas sp. WG]